MSAEGSATVPQYNASPSGYATIAPAFPSFTAQTASITITASSPHSTGEP